jgi:hypothetical protein
MSKAKPYSPRLEPDLIPILYRERQARHVPMTVLASRLIRAALRYEGILGNDATPRVAEKPIRSRAHLKTKR